METSKSKETGLRVELKEEEFVQNADAEEKEADEEEEDEEEDDLHSVHKSELDKFSRKSVRYASEDWDDGYRKKDKKGDIEDEEESYDSEEEEEEEEDEEESFEVASVATIISEVLFVWEDETYRFERLYDVTRDLPGLKKVPSAGEMFGKDGLDRYLAVCSSSNIPPMTKLIASLPTSEIDLTFRNLDAKEMKALCAALEVNNVVSKLLLRYNRLTPSDCSYIGYVLLYNDSISFLDLTGCRIGPQGMEAMTEFLGKNASIETLILSKCNLQDEGIKFLSDALIRNETIKNLDLSYNCLAEESGEPLAVIFKMNNTITDLKLHYNNLYEPTVLKPFFAALSTNPSLKCLDLSWNGLNGEEMAVHLAKFIKKNQCIEELDLSDNRIEGKALLELKKVLPKSKSLEVLKLARNPLSPEELDNLLNAVKGIPTLRVLDLDGLWVNKSFLKILNKIQQESDLEVIFEGVFSNYEVKGPDYPAILLKRAQYEAQKPKRKKLKRDFGHLMFNLGHKPITPAAFMELVKKFKAKVNKELYPELLKQFTMPKTQLIDVVGMRKKYLSLFPDSTPPPPKPKKGKKGKDVDEDEYDKFKSFEEEEEEEENVLGVHFEEVPEEEFGEEYGEFDYGELGGELFEEDESEESEQEAPENLYFATDVEFREFELQHQRMSKFLNL